MKYNGFLFNPQNHKQFLKVSYSNYSCIEFMMKEKLIKLMCMRKSINCFVILVEYSNQFF